FGRARRGFRGIRDGKQPAKKQKSGRRGSGRADGSLTAPRVDYPFRDQTKQAEGERPLVTLDRDASSQRSKGRLVNRRTDHRIDVVQCVAVAQMAVDAARLASDLTQAVFVEAREDRVASRIANVIQLAAGTAQRDRLALETSDTDRVNCDARFRCFSRPD